MLLLVAGVSGVRNAAGEWRSAANPGQKIATVSELAHGVASWVALLLLGARTKGARTAARIWAALITLTAGLAAIYWGEAPLAAALVGAVATALLCGFAIRLAFEPSNAAGQEVGR